MLYHPGTKKFCVLNPTAAYLWSRLEGPCTADELTASVLGAFSGVDASIAAQDVRETLRHFTDLGVITVTPAT